MTRKFSTPIQKLVERAERSQKAKRAPRAAGGVKHRASADEHAVRELVLYIDNESDLSMLGPRGQGKSMVENLLRKKRSGKYDSALAPKLWRYLADAGAKRYLKEFGGSVATFTPATRELAALQLSRDFEQRYDAGDFR